MRIAYVLVRYGADIRGGAEQGARMLAERLAARPGWSVDVYTTCAVEATTWADQVAPGTTESNGVTVHRFRSERGRSPDFASVSGPVLREPGATSGADQARWIDLQGPVCPAALEAAAAGRADLVVFYPYLYWPTVHGVRLLGDRAVLHPAAHDEPALRLPLFADVFGGVRGLVFQTDGERRLVERLFPRVVRTPQLQLGLGVEARAGDATAFARVWDLRDDPWVLCLGRVDDGKGAALLARWFAAYKARRPEPLKLVFAGPVVNRPPPHPDIVVTGPLDEDAKWAALRGAVALVSPSPHEAFSIVLMEAWTAGLPVLVNGACAATVEHARRSHGGLSFTTYAQFEVALDRVVRDRVVRDALGAAGRAYVEANFGWDRLMDRYAGFLEGLGAGTVP